MSDTPRTDAETWRDDMDHVDTDYTFAQSVTVSADFARQLERELAEAKQKEVMLINTIKNDRYVGRQEGLQIEHELAEARKERDMWKANLANQVVINRALRNRPDMGERARLVDELIKQRDALAKTVRVYLDTERDGGILYSDALSELQEALAAVKGGEA